LSRVGGSELRLLSGPMRHVKDEQRNRQIAGKVL
jgi:hypothetical protein